MKSRGQASAVLAFVVLLGLSLFLLRSPQVRGKNRIGAEREESGEFERLRVSRQSPESGALVVTKSRSSLSNNESRVRSHLALGQDEVGCLKLSRELLSALQVGGKSSLGVFSLSKEELISELKRSEHRGLMSDVSRLKKSGKKDPKNPGGFEVAVRNEMPPEIGADSWASVMGEDTRIPGFDIKGEETLLPSGERKLLFRYRHAHVVEWLQSSTGQSFPRISESSVDTQMRIAEDQVVVIPPPNEGAEGWVLFFGDSA